ncbi:MAG: glutamine amidotransferase [Desulfobulbaceae bacterium]|nr:MAG: glutamine amidotransferase [Desulfobulbaceae bacterium]
MTKKLAVYQHSPWEGPGRFLQQAARQNDIKLCIIRAWLGVFPDPADYHGFLLLGGSPNVDQEDRYPFLAAEKKSIRQIIATDKPCLGICLGHQLLADALGGQVGANFCSSVGLSRAFLTGHGRRHPLFAGIDSPFPTFKWHGQAVLPPVPHHFRILATSMECQVEAFSITSRPHLIGIQFDNHAAHPDDAAAWYEQDQKWLSSLSPHPITEEEMVSLLAANKQLMATQFDRLFTSFCAFL